MGCRYCKRFCKNANSLRNHERLCSLNENRQVLPAKTDRYYEALKTRKGSNQYLKAAELGLPKPPGAIKNFLIAPGTIKKWQGLGRKVSAEQDFEVLNVDENSKEVKLVHTVNGWTGNGMHYVEGARYYLDPSF